MNQFPEDLTYYISILAVSDARIKILDYLGSVQSQAPRDSWLSMPAVDFLDEKIVSTLSWNI